MKSDGFPEEKRIRILLRSADLSGPQNLRQLVMNRIGEQQVLRRARRVHQLDHAFRLRRAHDFLATVIAACLAFALLIPTFNLIGTSAVQANMSTGVLIGSEQSVATLAEWLQGEQATCLAGSLLATALSIILLHSHFDTKYHLFAKRNYSTGKLSR